MYIFIEQSISGHLVYWLLSIKGKQLPTGCVCLNGGVYKKIRLTNIIVITLRSGNQTKPEESVNTNKRKAKCIIWRVRRVTFKFHNDCSQQLLYRLLGTSGAPAYGSIPTQTLDRYLKVSRTWRLTRNPFGALFCRQSIRPLTPRQVLVPAPAYRCSVALSCPDNPALPIKTEMRSPSLYGSRV